MELFSIILFVIFSWILAVSLIRLTFFRSPHYPVRDFCPRAYDGYDCHGTRCDHSSRTWAMKGIDVDELTSQPYRGSWNDPLRER